MHKEITQLDAVRIFRMLKERKAVMQERHKLELAAVNDDLELVEMYIRRFMDEAEAQTGSTTFRTPAGTAYESEVESFRVRDPAVFVQWLLEAPMQRIPLLGNELSTTAVKAFLKPARAAVENAVIAAKGDGDKRSEAEIRFGLPEAMLAAAAIPGTKRSSYKNVLVKKA